MWDFTPIEKKKKSYHKKQERKKKDITETVKKKRKQKTGFYIPQPIEITHAASKIQAARPQKFTKNNIYYNLYILKH